jgi:hypothetical protein
MALEMETQMALAVVSQIHKPQQVFAGEKT